MSKVSFTDQLFKDTPHVAEKVAQAKARKRKSELDDDNEEPYIDPKREVLSLHEEMERKGYKLEFPDDAASGEDGVWVLQSQTQDLEENVLAPIDNSPLDLADAVQGDLFVLDLLAASLELKTDTASAEAPYFALGTNDLKPFEWESADGRVRVLVKPPQPIPEKQEERLPARATIHDKDILIYLGTQLVHALDARREKTAPKDVAFTAHDFFKSTGRPITGRAYELMRAALERLTRTYIYRQTKNAQGEWIKEQGFALLNSWSAERDHKDERMSKLKVKLAEPFVAAIEQRRVITLHREYFTLKPLAKAVYTVAAKHCGRQASFRIGLDTLRDKIGYRQPSRNLKADLADLAVDLPGYWVILEERGRGEEVMVEFRNKTPPVEPFQIGKMMARKPRAKKA